MPAGEPSRQEGDLSLQPILIFKKGATKTGRIQGPSFFYQGGSIMVQHLFTPGPVALSPETLLAGARPMMSHREPRFSALLRRLQNRLCDLMDVDGPILLLPGSGTGALEALALNLVLPEDRVLSLSCGVFGERFREIVARRGATVAAVDVEPGRAVTAEAACRALEAHPGTTVLLLTHNETSTGVTNDIESIVAALPREGRPLVLVDAVSSLGAMACRPQAWGVDGLASASQKGLVTPPGVALLWLSPRAWEKAERCASPSYYFDVALHRRFLEKEEPENPYTPPVSLLVSLDEALSLMADEGFSRRFEGRRRFAEALVAGAAALGLAPFVFDASSRSAGVTALAVPGGRGVELQKALRSLGIEAAGGQKALKGAVIRLAHYGDESWPELALLLGGLYGAMKVIGLEGGGGFIEAAFEAWKKER